MKRGVMFALLVACGGAAGGADEPVAAQEPAAPLCYWRHPEGCSPCRDRRDYGSGNTCEDVVWQGRSETDFCLQTYPCNYAPAPVTPIP